MNLKLIFLIVIQWCIILQDATAQNQQKTSYQKKISELTANYFSICYYGYNKPLSMYEKAELDIYTNGEEASAFILGIGILKYAMSHTETQVKKLVLQIDNDFKTAEKLKTLVDIQREKEWKFKKEELLKEKKQKELRESYLKTDKGKIYNNIYISFEKWNAKSEFEKENDYKARLESQSKEVFDKICAEHLNKRISEIITNLEYHTRRQLSTYNSEDEYFNITFNYNGISWQNKFNIPITQAAAFKEKWEDLTMSADNHNWCFVENSLFPKQITLKENQSKYHTKNGKIESNKSIYTFPYSNQKSTEITINFDELEINNEYLKSYIFNFSEVQLFEEALKKEVLRLDSLELSSLNFKLDSIFQHLNYLLLKNPYNTGKAVIQSHDFISPSLQSGYNQTISEERQIKFHKLKSSIERSFYELNIKIERELKSQNPDEFCKIYFNENRSKKIEADIKYLECRCHFQSRTEFDVNFIENKTNSCNCREFEFQKSGHLFTDRQEFNGFYDQGAEQLNIESKKRILKKEEEIEFNKNGELFSSRQEFNDFFNKGREFLALEVETRALKKEVELILTDIKKNSSEIEDLDFKNISIKLTNQELGFYYKQIENCKVKPYYSNIIDALIEINKDLKKEWRKNGELFNSKIEFYEDYTSDNYKYKLKERKNKDK